MICKVTSYSHNSTDGLRYLYYGTYYSRDIKSGRAKLNQAHKNHNGVTKRNVFISGIDCHASYKNAVRDFNFYNKQKPNRKVQAAMITLSFSKNDFNFRRKEDVYRAVSIGRQFVKKIFPNRIAIIAAQFDNENATPHLHCFISGFREDNLRAFSSQQKNIYHLRKISDGIVAQYNKHNPAHQITDMRAYRGQHHRTPTAAELSVLKPLAKALKYYRPTSQSKLRKACRKVGLKASFKRARKHSRGNRRGRRRRRRGLVFKSSESHGYIKASQLKYFSKWCPGIDQLHNYRSRKHLFKANWRHLKSARKHDIKVIDDKIQPAIYRLERGKYPTIDAFKAAAKKDGVIVTTNTYKKKNGKTGHGIFYSLASDPSINYSGYHFAKTFGKAKGIKYSSFKVSSAVSFGTLVSSLSAEHTFKMSVISASEASASSAAASSIHNRKLDLSVARRPDSRKGKSHMDSENNDVKEKQSNVASSASSVSTSSAVSNASASASNTASSEASNASSASNSVKAIKAKLRKDPVVANANMDRNDLLNYAKKRHFSKFEYHLLDKTSRWSVANEYGFELIHKFGMSNKEADRKAAKFMGISPKYEPSNDDLNFMNNINDDALNSIDTTPNLNDDLKQHYINIGRQQEKRELSQQLRIQPQTALDQFDRQNELDAKQSDWYKPADFDRDQQSIRDYWQPSKPTVSKLNNFFSRIGSIAKRSASVAMTHLKSATHRAKSWLHRHELTPTDWRRVANHKPGQTAYNSDIPFTKSAPLNKTIQRNIKQYHAAQFQQRKQQQQHYDAMHPQTLTDVLPNLSSNKARQAAYIEFHEIKPLHDSKLEANANKVLARSLPLSAKDKQMLNNVKKPNVTTAKHWLSRHDLQAPKLDDLIAARHQKFTRLTFRNGPTPDKTYLYNLKNPHSALNTDKRIVTKVNKANMKPGQSKMLNHLEAVAKQNAIDNGNRNKKFVNYGKQANAKNEKLNTHMYKSRKKSLDKKSHGFHHGNDRER